MEKYENGEDLGATFERYVAEIGQVGVSDGNPNDSMNFAHTKAVMTAINGTLI